MGKDERRRKRRRTEEDDDDDDEDDEEEEEHKQGVLEDEEAEENYDDEEDEDENNDKDDLNKNNNCGEADSATPDCVTSAGLASVAAAEDEEEEDFDEEDESQRERRRLNQKQKLKLVLKLPNKSNPQTHPHSDPPNNSSSTATFSNTSVIAPVNALVSASRRRGRPRKGEQQQQLRPSLQSSSASRRNVSVNDHDDDDEEDGEKPLKKRKLNAVAGAVSNGSWQLNQGSVIKPCSEKGDKQSQSCEGTENESADKTKDSSQETPMPERTLLEFILDKLQKKDTYSVFAYPVDPKELPDYHEIIQHPMDFSTIRKKLAKGVYSWFEQFEKDVFLICSNAMHYNASDTIYYKQARAIQELAKKKFQMLRTDPEAIEAEHRIALKAKPSSNNKKSARKFGSGRSLFEPTSSEFSGATHAGGGDSIATEKIGNGSANSDMVDAKAEKSEDFSASIFKGLSWKNGKRLQPFDENRRATYKPCNQLESGSDSIFGVLDGDSKQIIPIGVRGEYAYARSLARFSVNVGPIAWQIIAQRIQRALPPGVSFGPGWVGEHEAPRSRPISGGKLFISSETSGASVSGGENNLKQSSIVENSGSRNENPLRNPPLDNRPVLSPATTSPLEQMRSNSSKSQLAQGPVSKFQKDSRVIGDARMGIPTEEPKQGQLKPLLTAAACNDLSRIGPKFGSDVTQSRLLEMVSRNSTLMHALKHDNSKSATGLQPANSETTVCVNEEHDITRKTKEATSSSVANADTSMLSTPMRNCPLGSGVSQPTHDTNKQVNTLQELNGSANLIAGKMLMLPQKGSSIHSNNAGIISSSGPSVRQDNVAMQTWVQHHKVNPTTIASRGRLQGTPQPHLLEQEESQLRDFSNLVPNNASSESSRHLMTQYGRFHAQNSSKEFKTLASVSETASHSQSGTTTCIPNAHSTVWRTIPSQFVSAQTLSTSKSPDLNVEFQKSKSPPNQPSAPLADSQPDLALQL
eukprot:TRINITY_DN40380_c0_g1_i1.p1 TRINITY_DN40380_c0_g1~~TRINITY_DN40380_c0_g1_i1.p1  ORF type:complete len:1007 (-),score=265.22 TRINITY_DN40380_c0_g1_i1:264-3188(-)